MNARFFYAVALALPFIATAIESRALIADWFMTGICPGGPMDRPAHLCGFGEWFFITFLGGWAAFLVIPMLALWFALCTTVFALWRRRARSRSQA
jgi:hypothetical protein